MKTWKIKSKLVLYFVAVIHATAYCQEETRMTTSTDTDVPGKTKSSSDFMLALNTAIPFPAMTKAVQNNMGDLGFGLAGLFVFNPFSNKDIPVRFGGEIGYTYFGRFKTNVNINGYEGDYKTSYGIVTLHGIIRFRPSSMHRVVPFADAFAGGNFYVSVIKENLGFIESALGLQSFDLGGEVSASFSRGVGAGISIGPPDKEQSRFILRISYNMGTPIKYIVRNSLTYDQGNHSLTYQTGKASVKYIMVQIGIGF